MPAPSPTTRTVAEVMNPTPVTASSSESIAEVSARMAEMKKGSVVIVDGDRPIGILTERDLVRFNATGAASADTKVSEWMTQPVDCASPDLSVQEAFTEFAEHGYRHLPVVDDGKLVGVVSLRSLMLFAQVQPVVHPSTIEAPPGLEGVIVAETEVGDVRGLEGFYHYRQYNAVELADKLPLEDVWHLLIDRHLPSPAEREAFAEEVKPLRVVPESVKELLPALAASSKTVMEGVRSAMSMVGAAEGYQPTLDIDHAQRRRNALQMCAVMPTLIMSIARLQKGLEVIEPRMDLGYGANYLWMLTGEDFDKDLGRAVEQYQITTIDHGFNASTFTARVITSSGADVAAAVVGGMGALSGPLHGGAPSRALALLEDIGTVENARPYLMDAVARGEKIMGFGHRVYKTDDPRSLFLRGVAERIQADKVEFAKVVEQTVVDVLAELKPGRNLYANVEFYAGVVMDHCGLPPELFTPTFASSRVIGWCANILEQAADNRIIRPSARYVGPPPPQPVPDPQLSVPVTISIASADDAEELHAALQHLVPQLSKSNPPPPLETVRAMLAHDSVTQFLARREDGTIVGVSTLATFPIPTAVRSWVEDVIVDEASNNQGIGRMLIDAMVARAGELGAKTVDLTSRPSREAANHLYRKAGFEVRETNVYRFER